MKYYLALLFVTFLLSSCGSTEYSCLCIDKGNNDKEIVSYTLDTDKKSSASFECQQKELQFSTGDVYKDVVCELNSEEE